MKAQAASAETAARRARNSPSCAGNGACWSRKFSIHHLDTLRMLLGPLRVTAAQLSRSSEQLVGEDGAVIQLSAENGAGVSVFASFAAHGHPAAQVDRLEILGDNGAIRLDGPSLTCAGASPTERRL